MLRILALVCIALLPGHSWAQEKLNEINAQLSRLEKTVIALRQPFEGEKLHFGSDGALLDKERLGTFLNSAMIYVESVRSDGKQIHLKGKRCLALYDIHQRQLSNLVMQRKVEIHLDLSAASANDALSLSSVFITKELETKVKNYFLPNFGRDADWSTEIDEHSNPIGRLESSPVYRAKKDEVFPPTIKAKWDIKNPSGENGKSIVYVVVDQKGLPALLAIDDVQGTKLDLSALEALSKSTFSPGTTNDKPVAVIIKVESRFVVFR